MKQLTVLALASIFATITASAQAAPVVPIPSTPATSGWYYDVSAGALWLSDISIDGGYSAGFDTGIGANLELGCNLGNGLGIGVDVGYYHADLSTISGRGLNIDLNGDVKFVPVLLTAHYDVKLTDALSFNAGAGIGGAYTSTSISGIGGLNVSASDDSWELTFQAQAGFSYALTDATSVGVGYRYINVGATDLQGHLIQGSLNFRW
jgi:opacity protein-like surface antigen